MKPRSTILVVEDNPLTRKMLRVALQAEGYAVLEAGSGEQALAHMSAQPDLIVLDLHLPDAHGIDLARRLRSLQDGEWVPIIALSGDIAGLEAAQASAAAFSGLLVKPVEPMHLLQAVQAHLPQPVRREGRAGESASLLIVDDNRVQLKLTKLQLAGHGFRVEIATSAAEALERARQAPPDAIVSDVLMPGQDGFDLCLSVRRDTRLAQVPVVLVSGYDIDDADRDLAREVGANCIVPRPPDVRELVARITEAIAQGPVAPPAPGVDARTGEYALRVIRQLQRLLLENAALARRNAIQNAELAMLRGSRDTLGLSLTLESTLSGVLSLCMDAAGISRGALFLAGEDGKLAVHHMIGYADSDRAQMETLFGMPELLARWSTSEVAVTIPSPAVDARVGQTLLERAGVTAAMVVPMAAGGRQIGLLFMGSRGTESAAFESMPMARSLGAQISQSVALTMAFARLSASESNFRDLIARAPDAIAICRELVLVYANAALMQCLAVSDTAKIVGRSVLDCVHPDDRSLAEQRFNTEDVPAGEIRLLSADGEDRALEFSPPRTIDFEGKPAVLLMARDITERKKIQSQLLVSDRMASVGLLAAGVAHEINNPLAVVVANLELASEQLAQGPVGADASLQEVRDGLADAREGASRVAQIVRDIKMFSRGNEDVRELVDVRAVIDSTLRLAANEIRHRARIVVHHEDVPLVEASPSRLGQVFLNLLVNAKQALDDGDAAHNEIRVGCRLDDHGRVVVDIADTGSGIAPEVQKRLFTPFFTTKPLGQGTGLGLSICHRIVTALGGEITFESRPGVGTTFHVALPANRSAAKGF